jgi:AraC family transcriptional regulator of adaptative response / DNA-3-methyladenine glycosylase II
MLDEAECERARMGRDPAYDGRFFTGVRTTHIYCRPVCPVRPARAANVRFYLSAASAEAAGFRPCLRCRPETAPFCPAWNGSRTTVARALRLIEGGALDDEGPKVEVLAAKVGVGARHLSRLFAQHLGASPAQVARTARGCCHGRQARFSARELECGRLNIRAASGTISGGKNQASVARSWILFWWRW